MKNLWLLNIISIFLYLLEKENMSVETVSWRFQVEDKVREMKVFGVG